MNSKKRLVALLVSLVAIFSMLMGCGTETVKGDKVAKAFYNMFIKQDTTDIKDIGISDSEEADAMTAYKDQLKTQTKNNFTKSGITVSDADLDRIINAQLDLLKKLDAEITIVSEDDTSCDVKIATTYVDVTAIDTKAAEDAVNEVKAMQLTSVSEAQKKAVELYINNLVNALQAATPSADRKEDTYSFTKQKLDCNGTVKDVYAPTDYSSFGQSVGQMAVGAK